MLDVHEIKTQFPGHDGRPMKVRNDGFDFRIAEHGIVNRQFQAPVKQWMVIKNARFRTRMFVRPGSSVRNASIAGR